MGGAEDEADGAGLRIDFDRRLKLELHGSKVTCHAGLRLLRDLDDASGLSDHAGEVLADSRTGKNAVKWTRLSRRTMKANAVRLQLHGLAYNMANFLRTLVVPDEVARWSLTTLREKVVKIGAKVVAHARYTIFPMAEMKPKDGKTVRSEASEVKKAPPVFSGTVDRAILPSKLGRWAADLGTVHWYDRAIEAQPAIEDLGP